MDRDTLIFVFMLALMGAPLLAYRWHITHRDDVSEVYRLRRQLDDARLEISRLQRTLELNQGVMAQMQAMVMKNDKLKRWQTIGDDGELVDSHESEAHDGLHLYQ